MDRSGADQADSNDTPWTPSTPPIEVDSFLEVIDDHPIVVIHIWAAWNWYDREMDRILGEVRPAFEEFIDFRSFDADSDQKGTVTRSLGVANVPALACFLYGQRVETLVGLRTPREWSIRFEGWLSGIAGRPILHGPRNMFDR